MYIAIILLLILSIWAAGKEGRFFNDMNFKKYLLISGFFAAALFINRAVHPGFTVKKFFVYFIASLVILILFTLIGYYFFNKLCPQRKPARYIYFIAYFIFVLAFSSQYPFTILLDMYKKETYIDVQKGMADSYLPTARLFGINKLDIKLLQEDMLGAFVMPQGDYAKVVLTTGLRKLLTDKELCFVMAHEFTHYKEGHHKLRLIVALFALLLFFIFVYLFLKILKFQDESEFRLFLKFVPLQILLGALLAVGPLYLARSQEIRADLYALEVTKDKESALSTFEKTIKVMPDNQLDKYFAIFDIHPTTEERLGYIKKL